MAYIDGCVTAVPTANKDAYRDHAAKAWDIFKKHGAVSMSECWGDDVPEGKVNSFHTAVMRKPDESVVFSWIGWESREARDKGWAAVMDDPAMKDMSMPFDGSRMIFGGFDVVLEL